MTIVFRIEARTSEATVTRVMETRRVSRTEALKALREAWEAEVANMQPVVVASDGEIGFESGPA